jgi:hypothetical protein
MRNQKDEPTLGDSVILPASPDALLKGAALAAALTVSGFPITESTLATKRVRGGGPPFALWGRTPLYRWQSALEWAENRLTAPVCSTSEAAQGKVG